MKKFLSVLTICCVGVLSLLTACSNDEDNSKEETSINLAKGLQFDFLFSDYDTTDTTEASRASDIELRKETVPMGQLFADVTLQRGVKTRTTEAQTRALSDGTYTIYAYQGSSLKGTLKGTISGGLFTATTPNRDIMLDPGHYTFVCCNDKVNVSGNSWTITRANAGKARIGVSEITINPTP